MLNARFCTQFLCRCTRCTSGGKQIRDPSFRSYSEGTAFPVLAGDFDDPALRLRHQLGEGACSGQDSALRFMELLAWEAGDMGLGFLGPLVHDGMNGGGEEFACSKQADGICQRLGRALHTEVVELWCDGAFLAQWSRAFALDGAVCLGDMPGISNETPFR